MRRRDIYQQLLFLIVWLLLPLQAPSESLSAQAQAPLSSPIMVGQPDAYAYRAVGGNWSGAPMSSEGIPAAVQVVAGWVHTCALTTAGGVKCWGENSYGQLGDGTTERRMTPVDVVGLSSGVRAIAAAGFHTCAITVSGEVRCWGRNDYGQLGDGTTVSRLTPVGVIGLMNRALTVAAGSYFSCALVKAEASGPGGQGGLKCWGYNNYGQLGDGTLISRPIPADVTGLTTGVTAVATGGYHACALIVVAEPGSAAGGGVKCWGMGGMLGDGTFDTRLIPVDVIGLASGVATITAGAESACALTTGGGVKCWGDYYSDSGALIQLTPEDMRGLESGVIAIVAGGQHKCAVTVGGGVSCWGYNGYGQAGGAWYVTETPTAVHGMARGAVALAAGEGHTCALMIGGGIKCWGWNQYGQLGVGVTALFPNPVDVIYLPSEATATAVAAGGGHTCALMAGGGVKCWGASDWGQLGAAGLTGGVQAISAGGAHTCIIVETTESSVGGAAQCCGNYSAGQVGNGEVWAPHHWLVDSPENVIGLTSGVTAITAGSLHTCALIQAAEADPALGGGVKCWGDNGGGKLGDGTEEILQAIPVGVIGLASGVSAIVAGGDHTCALMTAGGIKCWGRNIEGQVGDGTTAARPTPKDVMGLPDEVTAVAAGGRHTCALTVSGGALCWGANNRGQLGNGTTVTATLPVQVLDLTSGVTAITAGMDHTCALIDDGSVKCWGANDRGQLGDGTLTAHASPVAVGGLVGAIALDAGVYHTCALTATGGGKCWGWNQDGQLGNGTASHHVTPGYVLGFEGLPLTVSGFLPLISR